MKRPTVGDKVIFKGDGFCIPQGSICEIVRDDNTILPYRIRWEGREMWVCGCDVELLPEPSPTRELRVGDTVRIKSKEWYESNKNSVGRVDVRCGFTLTMAEYCGREFKIVEVKHGFSGPIYILEGLPYNFSEEMLDFDDSTEPKQDRLTFTGVTATACRILGIDRKPLINGNIPLIKTKKLITNIKLD